MTGAANFPIGRNPRQGIRPRRGKAAPHANGSVSKGTLMPRNAAERNRNTCGPAWLGPAWGETTLVILGVVPPVGVPDAAAFTRWEPAPFQGQEHAGNGAPSANGTPYMTGRSVRPVPEPPLAYFVIVITGKGR